MTTSVRASALACALLATTALHAPVYGQASQTETARRYDATSPTGVSYPTGAYTYNLDLLSIGEGEFPRSLSYSILYNSGSARYPNKPWVHNLTFRMSHTLVDDPASTIDDPKPHPEWQTWLHSVVMGQRSAGFEKYGWNPSGPSPFVPVKRNGESLTFTSTDPQGQYSSFHGYYTYTGRNGEVVKFRNVDLAVAPGLGDSWVEPDGTRLDFRYAGGTYAVESNRGYAIFFEAPAAAGASTTRQACALNLTQHYLPSITACPSGVPTATVVSQTASSTGYDLISSITAPDGGVYNYQYSYTNAGGVERQHLNCVKQPGQSACMVANSYDTCDGENGPYVPGTLGGPDYNWTGSRDRVTSQTFATGEMVTYNYPPSSGACRGNSSVTMTDSASGSTTIVTDWVSGVVEQVTDPLSRTSAFTYAHGNNFTFTEGTGSIDTITSPEGDMIDYSYDDRGNIVETRRNAKPGSGLADIVTSAAYPASCANPKTCNKPTSTTDANGNVTDYTYDPVHGGALTETGPAVNGVRPQKRFSYAQRYAWIKNASGGYSRAASPVWVLASESICKTSAATGNPAAPCATAGDEVVTAYDYGPDSGPNNLLLRGLVVDAGGLNLRTCYTHDAMGNRIAETRPKAGLASCQ